jgi:N-acetylmuramoyl-L-alanine amidase
MSIYLNTLLGLALSACAGIVSASSATQVSQIILLQDDAATRVFVEISQQSTYKAFLLKGPDRAVLDIEGAEFGAQFKLPGANGAVLAVRQGKTPTGLRVVFDLAQAAKLSDRVDVSGAKPRLVLEIMPASPDQVSRAVKETAKPAFAEAPTYSGPLPTDSVLKSASAPVKAAPKAVSATSSVPGRSNVGYALMDDEIVQIDIDSRGEKSRTTVQPAFEKAPASLPNIKPTLNPTPAQSKVLPKKAKTVTDVLGASARKLVIAVDAGHGGKDPGAIGGNGLREKDVTLRVAKELAAIINADPGMRAVLIRDDDTFVALAERYQRARRAQADLFVSIHADAALNNAASGSSVFVLSTKGASSQAARWLADKENAADLVGGVSLDDKDKVLSGVLLDMTQSYTMRVSEDAAAKVLRSLKELGKAHKKEVEHANFVVLRSPDVPSMLIETGFITNPEEERKLSDPQHRKRLAFAIAQGVRAFFIEQPLPGTYYARKSGNPGEGVAAAGSAIIP